MSKVVVVFESADLTGAQYDAIMSELKSQNKSVNPHRPSHVSFDKDGKWCVVDVWESPEAMNEFVGTTLAPIFEKLKIPVPRPNIYPVHNYIGAKKDELISA